jgi:hypothetical protein
MNMKTPVIFHSAILIFVLSGCLSATMPGKARNDALDFDPLNLPRSDFIQESAKLQRITRDPATGIEEKAEAHRRLAILHLIPGNPERDPQKALDELGKFVELAPQRLDRQEAADWVLALNPGAGHRQGDQNCAAKTARLTAANFQRAKENEELTAANTELKETIEQIKKLDLSLEQKRRKLLR